MQNGPLTSRLQHLKEGDTILVSRKPVGTLVVDDLRPGKHLFLFGTGTGLAPFMSIIKDPDVYERFDKMCIRDRCSVSDIPSSVSQITSTPCAR